MGVSLKEFGGVKVFCQNFKPEVRDSILYRPKEPALRQLNRQDFRRIHDRHWPIERFHRVIQQVCNLERVQGRTTSASEPIASVPDKLFGPSQPCESRA